MRRRDWRGRDYLYIGGWRDEEEKMEEGGFEEFILSLT
jgi:hypothetical protein